MSHASIFSFSAPCGGRRRLRRVGVLLAFGVALALFGAVSRVARAEPTANAASAPSIQSLRDRHNQMLFQGILSFRSPLAPNQELILGDNTDAWGMKWTKCTNVGIHMLSAIVAESRGLLDAEEAKRQVRAALDILGRLKTHRGIFPENILIEGGIRGEVVDGRVRFSSIDSAWVTVALSLVEARYRSEAPDIGQAAGALVGRQDYRVFVRPNGLLGAGFYVDDKTDKIVDTIAFAYDDRNSEARPLVLALVGMGQLPASAWDNTAYRWGEREGVIVATGWHFSAFVEMTGALFFDESRIAPQSLGRSHENYVEASVRVAQRSGHQVFGYAPACDAHNPYAEFGLDRPDVVSPYAAALLTMTGDPRALANFDRVLSTLPRDGSALADGIDPRSGQVACGVARILDQGLMFLALNSDVVQNLVQKTSWYGSAERRLQGMDRSFRMPNKPKTEPSDAPKVAENTAVPDPSGSQPVAAAVPAAAVSEGAVALPGSANPAALSSPKPE